MSNIPLKCLLGAFAIVSITGCDVTANRDSGSNSGSNVISHKSESGSTYYFKREDVECRTINHPPYIGEYIGHGSWRYEHAAYSETECKANGYSQDLAGLQVAHSGEWRSCKADGYARTRYELRGPENVEVIVNEEYIKPYKKLSPKKWGCYAALRFGMY